MHEANDGIHLEGKVPFLAEDESDCSSDSAVVGEDTAHDGPGSSKA